MSYPMINNKKYSQYASKSAQQGVVLFFALIALVIMSLAGVALIRSVDTNSQVTGNLSFRQSAAISSSYGVEAVADTLGTKPYTYANTTDANNGFYADCNQFNTTAGTTDCNGAKLTLDSSWVPGGKSSLATGVGISAGVDAYGNTVQYIVERMCNATGAPARASCILATSDPQNGSYAIKNEPQADRPDGFSDSPIYRVTVRVDGPKNTVTYIQSFISAHS